MMLFERMTFIEMLYDQLPEKSKVKTGKRIVDIKEDKNGVQVILDDGTSESGDIVIGADGVHSFVRDHMHLDMRLDLPFDSSGGVGSGKADHNAVG